MDHIIENQQLYTHRTFDHNEDKQMKINNENKHNDLNLLIWTQYGSPTNIERIHQPIYTTNELPINIGLLKVSLYNICISNHL